MKVVIIGTGNVAHVLGRKIKKVGYEVVQVIGRNLEPAHELGNALNAPVFYNIRYLNPLADIYLVAVSDTELPATAALLKLNDKIVCHTSAATSINVLRNCSTNYGVLYPLQTLHKKATVLPEVPILIDANNDFTRDALLEFTSLWADQIEYADDEVRLKTHVAAVLVNNFTNHLFAVAEQYCEQEHLNFSLLQPLIKETTERIADVSPSLVQTGPAVRKDLSTIEKHQSVLNNHPKLLGLYNYLSNSVQEYYSENNLKSS